MNSLSLYWFSGTGNTWQAANTLAELIREDGVAVTLHRMEAAGPVALAPDATLGLAFPIACFSTYPVVWRFVDALPPGANRGVILLATMGGASGGMAGPLGRMLRAKGYRTLGALACTMPGNYGNRTLPVEANALRFTQMRTEVSAFAKNLLKDRTRWANGYPLWSEGWRRLSGTPRPWKWFKKMFPLAVDPNRCMRCGLCARLCPIGCIRMDEGRGPVASEHCQSCQRCIGYCPSNAIHVPGKPAEPYTAAPVEVMLGD